VRILVLSGDGCCGWPTSIYLSDKGRRAWNEVSGKELGWHRFDVADNYDRLLSLIQEYQPDAVAHFAEQVVSRFFDPSN
jgi:UDP-sulfoquinovose synthase